MLSPGDRLGRYEVLSALGAGGMGEVYRARDTQLDREVALKVLPAGALGDEAARKRFRKEAHALSRVSHPHVATLHDFDSAEGRDFLVMELVSGLSLEDALARGPLAEPEVVRIGAQVVRGLVAAHEQGVIHRDLKPSNIRLTADGLAKVLDFGLARTAAPAGGKEETTETSSGAVAGTPPYMSPEQLRGRAIDERTDVYGAGAVLYQMATGARPFGGLKSAELVAAILKEKPRAPREVNPEMSVSLEGVIEKATDKEPGLRYQSAKELLVDLERLAAGHSASAAVRARSSPSVLSAKPTAARTWRVLVVAALVALVAAAAAWRLWPREPRISAYRIVSRRSFPISGVVSDGSNIYFAEQRVPTDALLQMPLAGGEAREWPLPWTGGLGLQVIDFQKSPPSVLVWKVEGDSNGGELWRLPLPNGTPFRIGGLSRIQRARLSNGGDRLAYVQANEAGDRDALFVSDLEASKPRLVVEGAKGFLLDGWVPGDERIGYRTTTPTAGFWKYAPTARALHGRSRRRFRSSAARSGAPTGRSCCRRTTARCAFCGSGVRSGCGRSLRPRSWRPRTWANCASLRTDATSCRPHRPGTTRLSATTHRRESSRRSFAAPSLMSCPTRRTGRGWCGSPASGPPIG